MQGTGNFNILSNAVSITDGANLDAFSRLRTAHPTTIWAAQSQYGIDGLMIESGNTGTGSAPAWNSDTRMVSVSATAGSGTAFLQSFDYLPYEPGKSHLIKITGVLGTAVANAIVDVGYFDSANGIFYRQNGTSGLQFVRRTSTNGSVVNNAVSQSSWNLDKLDGTGASGLTLNADNAFILVIDLQFLGMGRVRCGFNINGKLIYAHEFLNANVLTVPYMQTASLPLGFLLTASSTGSTKTSYFKCAAIESEGGVTHADAFDISTPEATETAGSGTRTHILSIRPKTTFSGIANRETFRLKMINLIATGANPVYWELCIGATLAASTWADVSATYSAFEYTSVRGSLTNLTNGLVIASGYISGAGGGSSPPTVTTINPMVLASKYPISLDRAGAVRALGTLTLLVTGIGGTSATRASINFEETR